MTEDGVKTYALMRELGIATQLITLGFQELQRLDLANDRFHVPMLLLASGSERLLKATICLRIHEEEGKYPTQFPWPRGRGGHNLVPLLEMVLDSCFLPPQRL